MIPVLLTLLMSQTEASAARDVEFSHVPPAGTSSVSVVGSFNNWDRAAFPLAKQPDGKTWRATFKIAPGVYPYLFVENGNKWLRDPKAPPFPDANGNVNAKLVVLPADYDRSRGRRGDGRITESPLRHRPTREDSARIDEKRAYVRLRTRKDDVERIQIVLGPGKRPDMRRVESDELFDTWQGEIEIEEASAGYAFTLKDGQSRFACGPMGLASSATADVGFFQQDFSSYPLPDPPDWVQDAVFYQIFPERFANGDPANDGPGVVPWGSKPTAQHRMGGDLAGIRARMGHLRELGVTALYLNPVFEALSNHAYDTVDYMRVDPRFGTNDELKSLISELKKNGVRTVLDGVFNHSSPEFMPFRDIREKGQGSNYRDWFFVSGFPVEVKEGQKNYRTFAGVPTMPKLNQDHPSARDYFLSVGDHWIREAGAAGWRLDVADEVSQDFWRAFRTRVKAADSESYILGEVWGDAHEYLQGDQHDAAMNYRWRRAILDLLAEQKLDVPAFDRELARIRQDYPDGTLTSMFNPLGSHDTERLRTVFKKNAKAQPLAAVLQFTYPGVPCIYYGDEIGMEGGKDPDCRRCMEWDRSKWDKDLFGLYKSLAQLRNRRISLRRGAYRTLRADKSGLWAFERSHGQEITRIAIHAGRGKGRLLMDAEGHLLLSRGASLGKGGLRLEPGGFAVFGASP